MIGYLARKLKLVSPSIGPIIMNWLIIGPATAISFLATWVVEIVPDLKWLPVVGFLISMIMLPPSIFLGKILRLKKRGLGSFVLTSAMSNMGYTGGGMVLFFLLGEQAYARSLVYLIYWNLFVFLVCFPLANHYSSGMYGGGIKGYLRSIIDIRCLPLVGLFTGLALNMAGSVRPETFNVVIKILVSSASFVSFFSIGVTLFFSTFGRYIKIVPVSMLAKFILSPLIGLGLLYLLGITGLSAKVVMVLVSCPVAVYSLMIANIFDLEKDLANCMFVVSTVIFFLGIVPVLAVILYW